MNDFKDIAYLKAGNSRQRKAYSILNDLDIFEVLRAFNPILTGTIPIGIDLPDSDLDIICECKDHDAFEAMLKRHFGKYHHFELGSGSHGGIRSTVARFSVDGQAIEIFGQDIATDQQYAYRHMLAESRILRDKGVDFKQQVIELKKQGMKTEPAFATLLGLTGDPYLALLTFDTHSTDK